MFNSVYIYTKERSPLPFTLLLSFVLFASAIQEGPIDIGVFLSGWTSMALFLLFVRLSDDICDIPVDKITHPDRLLCSSTVVLTDVNYFRFLSVVIMIGLNVFNVIALYFLTFAIVFFLIFFRVKPVLPVLVHTTILNFSLFVFPVYAGYLLYGEVTKAYFIMGMFFWLGGLAHDYSHCLIEVGDQPYETLNPINRINPYFLAWLSLIVFIFSAGLGIYMIVNQWVTIGFTVGLLIMSTVIVILEVNLLRLPCEASAKPFYISGFVFFLLPALLNSIIIFYKSTST